MKTKHYLFTAIFLMAGRQLSFSQGGVPDQNQLAMEAAWMKFATPGAMHKMIAASDGDWNEEITMWMAPGAPETQSKAECTNSMIMDGRYQQSVHTGDFNGMPFHGISIWGFNNARKMFESSWIDNMGTSVMYMEGTYDEKTKSVSMKGKSTDPITGKQVMAREVMKFIDDKTQVMEMYETKEGKERKIMEIKFTRK